MSRPRSATGRGASAPAGRGATAGRGVFVQTPKSDVYVVLLGVALAAMIIGCILLVLILKRYDFKTKVSALDVPSSSALAINSGNSEIPDTVRL